MYGLRYGGGGGGAGGGMGSGGGMEGVEYGSGPTSGRGYDLAGGGIGGGDGGFGGGWEGVQRHHHPTRLSDVLEEDERSRTSPSRASERSRGVR